MINIPAYRITNKQKPMISVKKLNRCVGCKEMFQAKSPGKSYENRLLR